MEQARFAGTMDLLQAALEEKRSEEACRLAERLRADLLAESGPDPLQVGWARFMLFKALSYAGRDAEAFELGQGRERVPYAMPTKNVGWMHSMTAEVAARLKRPLEVVRHSRLCFNVRVNAGDLESAVHSRRNACLFLEKLGREDLNFEFADYLMRLGMAQDAPSFVVEGAERLLQGAERRPSRSTLSVLAERAQALEGCAEKELAGRARKAVERLRSLEKSLGEPVKGYGDGPEAAKALVKPTRAGDAKGLREALSEKAPADCLAGEDGRTPLMLAAVEGAEECAKLLLEAGADVRARESVQGSTPLLFAVNLGRTGVARLLLEHGAPVNQPGIFGQAPLHRAAVEDRPEEARLLLSWGAWTEQRDEQGATALQLAVTEDEPEVVEALLAGGASSKVLTSEKATLLHLAAGEGRDRIVRLLLDRGLDRAAEDEDGETPKDWAERAGHKSTAKLLGG